MKNNLLKNIKRQIRKKFGLSEFGWFGNYKTWKDAAQQTTGYNQQNILDRVKESTQKVMRGEAVYERDSVIFDTVQYSWPLLSALLWISAKNKNSLKVLDFGGSLGSTYFQNKKFLDDLGHVEWNIVEQETFVTTGREYIQNDILHFFYSVSECIEAKGCPDIVILSCVIPYLEKPYSLLDDLNQYSIPHLLIDNTPFNYEEKDRITIQKIPPHIFNASCPCWFLSYNQVKEKIIQKYTIVNEHYNESVIHLDNRDIQYRGLLAKLK